MLRARPRVPAPAAGLSRLASAVRARTQRSSQKTSMLMHTMDHKVRTSGSTLVDCGFDYPVVGPPADEDLEAARQRFLGTVQQQTPAWQARGDGADHKGLGQMRTVVVKVRRLELTRGGSGGRDVAFSLVCSKGTNVDVLMRGLVRPDPVTINPS